jgi:hypothetical protein
MKCTWIPYITQTLFNNNTKWHDKFIKKKVFQKGDWALLYDSRFKYFKGKLCTRWLGPYEVEIIFDNGTVKLTTIDDSQISLLVNGHRLRLYHQPLSKDSFLSHVISKPGFEIIGPKNHSPAPPTT